MLFAYLQLKVLIPLFSYGEHGGLIIHQALLTLFPEHHGAATFRAQETYIDPAVIKPLTHSEFLTAILLPYVAVSLIKIDMNCTWSQAKTHWKASQDYGMLINPDTDSFDNCPHPCLDAPTSTNPPSDDPIHTLTNNIIVIP